MKKIIFIVLFEVVVIFFCLKSSTENQINTSIQDIFQSAPESFQVYLDQAKALTLEDKVRQVLVCGYSGNDVQKALELSKVCGNFLLLQGNVTGLSEDQIAINNIAIHQNDHLAWIMVDQEGGRVSLTNESSPSAKIMGKTDTASFWGNSHGKYLKSLDIDVNLAPVADITGQSPAIGDRSFSDDPQKVGTNAILYLKALQKNNILAVVKHLPGHGRVLSDTHTSLGKLKYSWDEIKSFDLVPFIEASNNGAEIFMVGHIIVPEVDIKPASISQKTIDKLRTTLPRGQDLLFITDSLSMKGVGISEEKASIEALNAGEDLLIIQGDSIPKIYQKILESYKSNTLNTNSLDFSVAKILQLKARFGRK